MPARKLPCLRCSGDSSQSNPIKTIIILLAIVSLYAESPRDPWLRPFGSTSIWDMPIGSEARYGYFPDHPDAWRQNAPSQTARSKQGNIPLVFPGDSLTHNLSGQAGWTERYAKLGAVNYGVGGDGNAAGFVAHP